MIGHRPVQRRLLAGVSAAIVVGVSLLTACSTQATGPTTSSQPSGTVPAAHNQQDVAFAIQVIELSQQLNTVTDIMIGRDEEPAVESQLADLSRTAKERVALCRSWLQAWGASATATAPSVPGMVPDDLIERLITSDGAEYAAALNRFVSDQQAGIETVSTAETSGGSNQAAVEFARELPARSRAELALLTTRPRG